jgi:glycosyltransferase involved in cell wall biosynthesis
VALGHQLAEHIDEADIVYSNDEGGYQQILSNLYGGKIKKDAKVIFNVLDIPEHNLSNYDLEGLATMLKRAHAVTCISAFVKDQLTRYIKQDSQVIYNPIKPVLFKPEPRPDRYARFLSVGRRQDPNKRFTLGVSTLLTLGINYGQLGLVGGEYASYGEYFGVLDDKQLNRMYNSVDFVLSLGKVEGLNLTVLEAMAAGVIPIVCNDMTTRKELLPPDLFPEYNEITPTVTSVAHFIARYMQDNGAMQTMKGRLRKHYEKAWATKVSPVGVAKAIIDVYGGLSI